MSAGKKRVSVFFDIAFSGEKGGRIVFEVRMRERRREGGEEEKEKTKKERKRKRKDCSSDFFSSCIMILYQKQQKISELFVLVISELIVSCSLST